MLLLLLFSGLLEQRTVAKLRGAEEEECSATRLFVGPEIRFGLGPEISLGPEI